LQITLLLNNEYIFPVFVEQCILKSYEQWLELSSETMGCGNSKLAQVTPDLHPSLSLKAVNSVRIPASRRQSHAKLLALPSPTTQENSTSTMVNASQLGLYFRKLLQIASVYWVFGTRWI
jgi:hypothetical protein